MEKSSVAYRGFEILVSAAIDHDDLWDYEYRISHADASAAPSKLDIAPRTRTKGQYATEAGACDAGVEVAKIEIDNLIALTQK
ncbi:MAG: hypothetical protein H7240_07090 [Glaciimonas sp.]|nr:hypothetical protein [Glaciimonas sp.]